MRANVRHLRETRPIQGPVPVASVIFLGGFATYAFFWARGHFHLVGLSTPHEMLMGKVAWYAFSGLFALSGWILGRAFGEKTNARGFLAGLFWGMFCWLLFQGLLQAISRDLIVGVFIPSLVALGGCLSWLAGYLWQKKAGGKLASLLLAALGYAWVLGVAWVLLFYE